MPIVGIVWFRPAVGRERKEMGNKKKNSLKAAAAIALFTVPAIFAVRAVSAYVTPDAENKAAAMVSMGTMDIEVQKEDDADSAGVLAPGSYYGYKYTIKKLGTIPSDIYQIVSVKVEPAEGQSFALTDRQYIDVTFRNNEALPVSSSAKVLRDNGNMYLYYIIHTLPEELPDDQSELTEDLLVGIGKDARANFSGCTVTTSADIYSVQEGSEIATSKIKVGFDGTLKFYDDFSAFAEGVEFAEPVITGGDSKSETAAETSEEAGGDTSEETGVQEETDVQDSGSSTDDSGNTTDSGSAGSDNENSGTENTGNDSGTGTVDNGTGSSDTKTDAGKSTDSPDTDSTPADTGDASGGSTSGGDGS